MANILKLSNLGLVLEHTGALGSVLPCAFGTRVKIALLGLLLYIYKNPKLDNWVNWEWLESSVLPVLKLIFVEKHMYTKMYVN